jgi:hypothetical protein
MMAVATAVPSKGGAQLSVTVLMMRHSMEDRRVADRVDDDKIHDECGDEGLNHPPVVRW